MRYAGDDIILKEDNVARSYTVEITQRQFIEEDPFNECRDYPNPEYASYDECENKFMRASLPGLTPVWITEDPAEVTIQKEDKNGTYCKFPMNFFLPGFDTMSQLNLSIKLDESPKNEWYQQKRQNSQQ